MTDICSQASCSKQAKRRGLCYGHDTRKRRYGSADFIPPGGGIGRGRRPVDLSVRFKKKCLLQDNGCHVWTGPADRFGYGLIWIDGQLRAAHRVSYEHFVGPIPNGLEIDHLCRVPACVNPKHLEPVTHQENVLRGFAAKRAANPELHAPIDLPEGVKHGTVTSYSHHRCRCEACTVSNRRRCRRVRAELRERLQHDPSAAPHGTASTYTNWGCRCEPCRKAHGAQLKDWLAKRSA